MTEGGISIAVDVRTSEAVCELFDISQSLCSIVDLVPAWRQAEATKAKDRILNTLLDWVDAKSED